IGRRQRRPGDVLDAAARGVRPGGVARDGTAGQGQGAVVVDAAAAAGGVAVVGDGAAAVREGDAVERAAAEGRAAAAEGQPAEDVDLIQVRAENLSEDEDAVGVVAVDGQVGGARADDRDGLRDVQGAAGQGDGLGPGGQVELDDQVGGPQR